MVFVGKIAYLVLFPGTLFVLVCGAAVRVVMSGTGAALLGSERTGAGAAGERSWTTASGAVPDTGSLQAVVWLTPLIKVFSLAWVSCIVLGFLSGDLVLLFALMLVAAGSDVFAALLSSNPRTKQEGWRSAVSFSAWAAPFAVALCAVALRTGEVTVSGVIGWQAARGVMPLASAGSGFARAGIACALVAAFVSMIAFAGLRPLGRGCFSDAPGGILADVSGPPLAFFAAGRIAALFIAPLLIVALFLAGPAGRAYEIVFWVLKVAGVVLLLSVADALSARAGARAVAVWGVGFAGGLAVAGLVLTWIGVAS